MEKKLNGLLNLFLLKSIAVNIEEKEIEEKIKSKDLRAIILYLKESNVNENINSPILHIKLEKQNIISYSKYVDPRVNLDDINNLISILDNNKQTEIKDLWKNLLKFEEKSMAFEKHLFEVLSKSYFEYYPFEAYFNLNADLDKYTEEMKKCSDSEIKILFNGCRQNTVVKKLENGINYPMESTLGIGIYFSDSLDYTSFFGVGETKLDGKKNFGNVLSLDKTFSCIGAEIYYDKNKLKNIYDLSYSMNLDEIPTYEKIQKNYNDKMIEKNGIHLGKIEIVSGHPLKEDQACLKKYNGKFIGKEYVITEKEQILPLYGFNFNRSGYIVIWKDPKITGENKNTLNKLIEKGITNIYLVKSLEKALELIKRKKYNKIILISNAGKGLSGKKFVKIARKILGYDIVILFYIKDKRHFDWIKDFPNSLGCLNKNNLMEYVEKYDDLINLKNTWNENNDKKFNLDDNYIKNLNSREIESNYNSLVFDKICPYFRKVIIKSKRNQKVLKMNTDQTVSFIPYENLDIDSAIWYITNIDNEITFYSNEFYLGIDEKEKMVKGFEDMNNWKFEVINKKYLIYYENKNNVLTINENKALLKEEDENKQNQLFDLIDVIEK